MSLLTCESVRAGHPDKICDQVSDHLLDYCLSIDEGSRTGIETAVKNNSVYVLGEVTTSARFDDETVKDLVRECFAKIGFSGSCCDGLDIIVNVSRQSPDIARGVDVGGAGDQGMMIGYACRETDKMLPMPLHLSHNLCMALDIERMKGATFIELDGKAQVTVEYDDNGNPKKIDTVVVSVHHNDRISLNDLREFVKKNVIYPVLGASNVEDKEPRKIFVNPSGEFLVGGAEADSGVTGRKIIVDTYGGVVGHGGGAFSGKDPTKVDRSGAYASRYASKHLLYMFPFLKTATVRLSYAIGVAEPVEISVDYTIEDGNTDCIDKDQIGKYLLDNFDFTPKSIIDGFQLRKQLYFPTASYGHFTDSNYAWEKGKEKFLSKKGE